MPHTVLIIEDNEQNRYLESFLLEQAGLSVVTARDGPEGVQWARRLRPDLILLDIQLPGMDGFAVARAVRESPGLQHVPMIAVTAYAMVGDRERILQAGFTGYLEKPINPETFAIEVRRYLPSAAPGGAT